jgi:hypothetical protein
MSRDDMTEAYFKTKEQKRKPFSKEAAKRNGTKGGLARAKSLTPEKRKAIAQKAALTRWKKK